MTGSGFPRKLRLTDAGQFKAVFDQAKYKVSNRNFLILAIDNRLQHGRLGLVTGKKNLPRAVHRNRVKRLLRTTFRTNQDLLLGLDMVILARSKLSALDNRQIAEEACQLLQDLNRKVTNKKAATGSPNTPC